MVAIRMLGSGSLRNRGTVGSIRLSIQGQGIKTSQRKSQMIRDSGTVNDVEFVGSCIRDCLLPLYLNRIPNATRIRLGPFLSGHFYNRLTCLDIS
jgi:hypothetical protein